MAEDVRITLEPIRLQAITDIGMLKAAHAADEEKKRRFVDCLERLVDELNSICGSGMGINVTYGGGNSQA
jgi:hypothetical protein